MTERDEWPVICHCGYVAKNEVDFREHEHHRGRVEWDEKAAKLLSRCGGEDDIPHYCPNCDNSAPGKYDVAAALRGLAAKWDSHIKTMRSAMDDTVKRIVAERDAALAEVERLRALVKMLHKGIDEVRKL